LHTCFTVSAQRPCDVIAFNRNPAIPHHGDSKQLKQRDADSYRLSSLKRSQPIVGSPLFIAKVIFESLASHYAVAHLAIDRQPEVNVITNN